MLGVTYSCDCPLPLNAALLSTLPPPHYCPPSPSPLHMPRSSVTALSSSSSSTGSQSQSSRDPLPFTRSYTDFEMERAERPPKTPPSYTRSPPRGILRKGAPAVTHPTEDVFHNTVTSLMTAKSRPFSISGHIPLEPGALTIFLRSQVRSCFFASIFRRRHG